MPRCRAVGKTCGVFELEVPRMGGENLVDQMADFHNWVLTTMEDMTSAQTDEDCHHHVGHAQAADLSGDPSAEMRADLSEAGCPEHPGKTASGFIYVFIDFICARIKTRDDDFNRADAVRHPNYQTHVSSDTTLERRYPHQ